MYSFERNRDLIEVRGQLARLINRQTIPVFPDELDDRVDSRCRHMIPVEIIMWENDAPFVSETMTALTCDISDTGIGIIMHHPLRVEQIVLGFWIDESSQGTSRSGRPLFLLADVVRNASIGGHFWQVGTRVTKVLRLSAHDELEQLAPRLAELAPKQQEDPELLHTIRERLRT